MDQKLAQNLAVLLQKEGLEPKEGDLERFRPLLEQYVTTLETLRSVDVGQEEIAGTFHPE
ncbi:MAG: hypothetical protein ACREQ7_06695 [Candidatus Binatia bacterium]